MYDARRAYAALGAGEKPIVTAARLAAELYAMREMVPRFLEQRAKVSEERARQIARAASLVARVFKVYPEAMQHMGLRGKALDGRRVLSAILHRDLGLSLDVIGRMFGIDGSVVGKDVQIAEAQHGRILASLSGKIGERA